MVVVYIHPKGFEGRSLLHYACNGGMIELTKVLITDFKLDPLIADDIGNTPLHIVCWGGHEELALKTILIIMYNCPVDFKNKNKWTPLHLVCSVGHCSIAQLLVSEFMANLRACDWDNDTPVSKAALGGYIKIACTYADQRVWM